MACIGTFVEAAVLHGALLKQNFFIRIAFCIIGPSYRFW